MANFDYKEFEKRYDKFKKNNLPTPFFDVERQTFEYIYFYNGKSIFNSEEAKDSLEVNTSLIKSLEEIAFTGFYYPFTCKMLRGWRENGKTIREFTVGHSHAHSFEEVVEHLYNSPESFSISKEEKEFYSKQELEYLRRVQKYLLFIGLKDVETEKIPVSRYRNKIHKKYENACIYRFSDETLKNVLNGKRNFRVIDWYPEYSGDKVYQSKEYQALIVDKEDNFKLFVEFTKEEAKEYKDIKQVCKLDNLKDEDKIIVFTFKILERY